MTWLDRIISVVGGAIVAAVAVIVMLQVILRYVWQRPLIWPEEVSQLLLIILVFLGAVLGELHRSHIRLDYVFLRVPTRIGRILLVIGYLATIPVLVYFLLGEWQLYPRWQAQRTPAARIPLTWLHVTVALSVLLWLVSVVINLLTIKHQDPRPKLDSAAADLPLAKD